MRYSLGHCRCQLRAHWAIVAADGHQHLPATGAGGIGHRTAPPPGDLYGKPYLQITCWSRLLSHRCAKAGVACRASACPPVHSWQDLISAAARSCALLMLHEDVFGDVPPNCIPQSMANDSNDVGVMTVAGDGSPGGVFTDRLAGALRHEEALEHRQLLQEGLAEGSPEDVLHGHLPSLLHGFSDAAEVGESVEFHMECSTTFQEHHEMPVWPCPDAGSIIRHCQHLRRCRGGQNGPFFTTWITAWVLAMVVWSLEHLQE